MSLARAAVLALLFIGFAAPVIASDDVLGFRSAGWGATEEQVVAAEGKDPDERLQSGERTEMFYSDKFAGRSCVVGYHFLRGRLARGIYRLADRPPDYLDYFTERQAFLRVLVGDYGEPLSDNTYWKYSTFKNYPPRWGTALAARHMAQFVRWETEKSVIVLVLGNRGHGVELTVEFTSKEFVEFESEVKTAVPESSF